MQRKLNSREELELYSRGEGGKENHGRAEPPQSRIPASVKFREFFRWGKQGKQEGEEFLLLSPRPCERGPCAASFQGRKQPLPLPKKSILFIYLVFSKGIPSAWERERSFKPGLACGASGRWKVHWGIISLLKSSLVGRIG